jgi:hypothetical protein
MKASRFLWGDPGGAWAKLARASVFGPRRRDSAGLAAKRRPRAANTPAGGLLARLDAWFWRQAQRDREAYLARASDIFELEHRIRRLEREEGRRFG